MFNKNTLLIFSLILLFCFSACVRQEKFNKQDWLGADAVDPERESITDHLLKNYKIIGSSHNEIIQLLGEPAFEDSTGMFYTLSTEYKYLGIDPVSGKNLELKINKDSIITKAEVKDWKRH